MELLIALALLIGPLPPIPAVIPQPPRCRFAPR
jgi:hypothetical protein